MTLPLIVALWEAEARGLQIGAQLGQPSKALSQNKGLVMQLSVKALDSIPAGGEGGDRFSKHSWDWLSLAQAA